jgi:hypothetical protein
VTPDLRVRIEFVRWWRGGGLQGTFLASGETKSPFAAPDLDPPRTNRRVSGRVVCRGDPAGLRTPRVRAGGLKGTFVSPGAAKGTFLASDARKAPFSSPDPDRRGRPPHRAPSRTRPR